MAREAFAAEFNGAIPQTEAEFETVTRQGLLFEPAGERWTRAVEAARRARAALPRDRDRPAELGGEP